MLPEPNSASAVLTGAHREIESRRGEDGGIDKVRSLMKIDYQETLPA
jgi:hypothetical protein